MPTSKPVKSELLAGTLEMLVLKTLSFGALHGYAIAQNIQRLSADALRIDDGSLYPALQRMLAKGWVTAEWKETPTRRQARYYKLTAAGKRQLTAEATAFDESVAAITRVMRVSEG
jgi:PadR family transcriptional regulator, regulatory protein PadR